VIVDKTDQTEIFDRVFKHADLLERNTGIVSLNTKVTTMSNI